MGRRCGAVKCKYSQGDYVDVPEEPGEDYEALRRGRYELALGAAAFLLLSAAAGMLPDSILPSYYRTAGWMIFALAALFLMYLAFPHMWVYGLWLAGIYAASVFGLLLVLLGGERLFARYWAAAGIGALMELAALFLVYTLLMRVRIARSVLGSRAPLGIWLVAVVMFYILSNAAGYGLAVWFSVGSPAALAAYAGLEIVLALAAVYICWAPEQAIWAARSIAATAPGPVAPAAPSEKGPAAMLMKIVGRREAGEPKSCPACGAPLRNVKLICPACGGASDIAWCGASESYVVPCPSCGAHTLSSERKCMKCGASLPAYTCPGCKRASPIREWRMAG